VAARYPALGTVLQVPLPDGTYAYGRVLRDASVAFYRTATEEREHAPIGSRDFAFCVGVYRDVVLRWKRVGLDPFTDDEDDGWPPPHAIRDPLSSGWRIYHRGTMRAATEDEAAGLEPAAVWDEQHVLPRLMEAVSHQ
jgi:hypothetical protein